MYRARTQCMNQGGTFCLVRAVGATWRCRAFNSDIYVWRCRDGERTVRYRWLSGE